MRSRTVPAGEFKQRCLAMLDEVAARHEELVITKRGRPVARLVPMRSQREHEDEILAVLRARTRVLVSDEELMRPSSADTPWAALGQA